MTMSDTAIRFNLHRARDRLTDRRQVAMPANFVMRELLGKEEVQELHFEFKVSVKSLRQNIEQTQLGALPSRLPRSRVLRSGNPTRHMGRH